MAHQRTSKALSMLFLSTLQITAKTRPADKGTVDSATVNTILLPLPDVLAGPLWFPYILSLILIFDFSNFRFRTFYHILPFPSIGCFTLIFYTPFLSLAFLFFFLSLVL